MTKLLSLGRIEGARAAEAALSVAKSENALPMTWLGRVKTELVPWLNCADAIAEWDCLNVASVALFLRHAEQLEGIPVNSRLQKSRWRHLPDYEETYWLPLDFSKVHTFKSSDGWPFAIASAQALLRDLEAIGAASPYPLKQKPAELAADSQASLTPEDTLSWIWCALFEGASECVARSAPLAISP
jgi:hypothetical protein